MKQFSCELIDTTNTRKTIIRMANTKESLLLDLNRQGFLIISITELSDQLSQAQDQKKLSPNSILEFTKTMQVLLESGLGLKDALSVGKELYQDKEAGVFLTHISDMVGKGNNLAQSLELWRTSLGSLYLGLVRIGEKAGNLAPIFAKLYDYLQLRKQLRDKLTSSMMYPLIVLSIAVVGMSLLVTFVFPILYDVVASLKKSSSSEFQNNLDGFKSTILVILLLVLLSAIAAFTVYVISKKNPVLRLQIDRFFWKLAFIGKFSETMEGLYFCFAMETMLASGYSLEKSLEEASLTVGNSFFRNEIIAVRDEVLKGADVSAAMEGRGIFSRRMLLWIRIGEKAGQLDQTFGHLRQYYQQEVDKTSARLMSLVEPGLILAVGIILMVLISNVITPIFGMMGDLL